MPLDCETGSLRQRNCGPHTHAEDNEIRGDHSRVAQRHPLPVDATNGPAQVKYDAVRHVQVADKFTDFWPHDPLKGYVFGPDDMNVDPARAERCGNLEADEACADYNRALRGGGFGNDGPTVCERAQVVKLRRCRAGDVELHRLGTGREQQRVERMLCATFDLNASSLHVERRHARIERRSIRRST
jgi:hypothetical protein